MTEGLTHMRMRHHVCEALEQRDYRRGDAKKGYLLEHDDRDVTPIGGNGLSLFYHGPKSMEARVSKPDIFVLEGGRLRHIIEIEDKANKKYCVGVLALTLLTKHYSIGRGSFHDIEKDKVNLFLIPLEGDVLDHLKVFNKNVLFPALKPSSLFKRSIVCSEGEFAGRFDEVTSTD